jgi:hypothetical protein
MKGSGIVLWSSRWISTSEPITPRIPGRMQNRPAAVATE